MIANIMKELLSERNSLLSSSLNPLPGSVPYNNYRPLNIPGRYDGYVLFDVVLDLFPHIDSEQWLRWFDLGHLQQDNNPVHPSRRVRGGESFQHLFPNTIEPAVNANIRWIWEDEDLVGLVKPAPLPVHPCGRFNRNTLTYFLDDVLGFHDLRLVHRLDANTSGLMVLAKSAQAATNLRKQFESGEVSKHYLARVIGHPDTERLVCDAPIGRNRHDGGSRSVEATGQTAYTEFQVLKKFKDGTCLISAKPKTGRTNQIRIHLWELGFPIVGDPTYRPKKNIQSKQTLDVDEPMMCLHAQTLGFLHPRSSESLRLNSELPAWANETAEALSPSQ